MTGSGTQVVPAQTVESYRTDILPNGKTRNVAVAPDRDCEVCGRPAGLCCVNDLGVALYGLRVHAERKEVA